MFTYTYKCKSWNPNKVYTSAWATLFFSFLYVFVKKGKKAERVKSSRHLHLLRRKKEDGGEKKTTGISDRLISHSRFKLLEWWKTHVHYKVCACVAILASWDVTGCKESRFVYIFQWTLFHSTILTLSTQAAGMVGYFIQ